MEYKGNKIYWVITECFVGPTEWSEEDESQEKPCAVFEEPEKLIEYVKRERRKSKETFLPRFNIYEIRWKPGAEAPNVGTYIEGLPTEELVRQAIDRSSSDLKRTKLPMNYNMSEEEFNIKGCK